MLDHQDTVAIPDSRKPARNNDGVRPAETLRIVSWIESFAERTERARSFVKRNTGGYWQVEPAGRMVKGKAIPYRLDSVFLHTEKQAHPGGDGSFFGLPRHDCG